MRRVRDCVRMRIHLTGRLEAAKDQDHERHKDHHDDDDKNEILNESCEEFLQSRCAWGWLICFHKFTFLESGQIIRLARQTLVNQRKDQAEKEHIDRHGRTITQLETYETEAIHVRCQSLACIDR